jgi:hypothetical protein
LANLLLATTFQSKWPVAVVIGRWATIGDGELQIRGKPDFNPFKGGVQLEQESRRSGDQESRRAEEQKSRKAGKQK